MVRRITKSKHEDSTFLVFDSSKSSRITKTMIFVNDIKDV